MYMCFHVQSSSKLNVAKLQGTNYNVRITRYEKHKISSLEEEQDLVSFSLFAKIRKVSSL